ncbi:hypothetical protein C8J57DRAFT_1534354 [Mycena rebaudengoi]|nr:hypothetical protein C8J57DRAFT_1534354 [Mycena rebaudengoi]
MAIVNDAAAWYFSRSRAETMMVNASAYGIAEEDDDSDREPEDDSEEYSSDQSDYEIRRRKKKKQRQKKVRTDAKAKPALRSTLKTEGTADEVTGLIRQLNKMSIDDPEYSPVFYKVLTMDKTGIAAKPWQRSNLVTIDEREEGTYLVFKDPETRRPRYELLAIPHDAGADTYHYLRPPDSLAYIAEDLKENWGSTAPRTQATQNEDTMKAATGSSGGYVPSSSSPNVLDYRRNPDTDGNELHHSSHPTSLPSYNALILCLQPICSPEMTRQATDPPDDAKPDASETQVLSRDRYGSYGPLDDDDTAATPADAIERTVDKEWYAHLHDHNMHENQQEVHRGVMLNACMLLHNPDTGVPRSQNGHAYFFFKAAPADPHETWDIEVPYAPEESIRKILLHYADVAVNETQGDNEREREDGGPATGSTVPDEDASSTSEHALERVPSCGMPDEPVMYSKRRYRYLHFPGHRIPPFDVSHMQSIGTTCRGEPVLRFTLQDDSPVPSQGETESPKRFDTPVPPFCLLHACPPLDRPLSDPQTIAPIAEGEPSPQPQNQPQKSSSRQIAVHPKYPVAQGTAELVAEVLAHSTSPVKLNPEAIEHVWQRLRKRRETTPINDGETEKKRKITASLPPVTEVGDSAAAQLRVPEFRARGPVISRDHYSSSPEPSHHDSTLYAPSLSFLNDAMTEVSVDSDESDVDPRLVLDTAIAKAQRQLAREQPRTVPFVGMLLTPPAPTAPRLDSVVKPATLNFHARSPPPNTDLFTWSPMPGALSPVKAKTFAKAKSPVKAKHPGPCAPLPGGRPLTIFDEYLNQELSNESAFHELPMPAYPASPASDSSMPSLRSIDSFDHVERGELDLSTHAPRLIPAAAQSTFGEPAYSPRQLFEGIPIESVSVEELKAALQRIYIEYPHDEGERRRAIWQQTENWNWGRRQHIKLFRHNRVLLVIKPFEDTIHTIISYLAGIFDYDAMRLGDHQLMQHIARLLPNTPADEVIRLKSRMVCTFIDLGRPHTYNNGLEDALQSVDSMALNPSDEHCVDIPTTLPPSPRGDRFRRRAFNDNAIRKGPVYLAAIKAEYDRDPTLISHFTNARICILEGLRQLDIYAGHRLWEMDLSVLHRTGPSPLPFVHDREYAQLRVLGDACDAFGDFELHDIIDRLFRIRFRKSTLVSHFLQCGLLDPAYDARSSTRWEDDSDSEIGEADMYRFPRLRARTSFKNLAPTTNLESLYQAAEFDTYATTNVPATASPEPGRPVSAPPSLNGQSSPAYTCDGNILESYQHECAAHTFSTCRPFLRTYLVAPHA